MTHLSKSTAGVLFAVASYSWWAIVTPLYFKVFKEVPIVELVVWRILSGLPLLLGLLYFRQKISECYKVLLNKKTALILLASAFFISVNWVVYVISVVDNKLLDSSLGYYINPLVTVALGYFFLGERLRMLQIVAVGIACIGVVYLTISQGSLPWISVTIAATFSMYGLLRKVMGVGSLEGLTIEMTFALPICLVLQWWLVSTHQSVIPSGNTFVTVGLLMGGLITIVPLLLFAGGARRVKLATMGILQYIAPTGQLLLATFVFHESFGIDKVIVFSLIWLSVLLYSYDSWRSSIATVEPVLE